ncbi:MAG: hypothetical protein JW755_13740 [Candidatus Aminicenantes bacterium]|nr:hypothetical protein [Candidatus Aminicenantes bacterium]
MNKFSSSEKASHLFIRTFIITVVLSLSFSNAGAQALFQFSINGQLAFPQDEFKRNTADLGGGFGFDFIYDPRSLPFGFGASLGFIFYGYESYREIISTSATDFEADVSTTNSIFTGHLLFRFQPYHGKIRPYIEGLVGINYLTTDTKIDQAGWGDDGIHTHNFDDAAFSYGGGIGILYRIVEKPFNAGQSRYSQKRWAILIDIKLRYILGGEAEYLNEGSIYRENNELYYDVKMSRTDMLTVNIGVTFNF